MLGHRATSDYSRAVCARRTSRPSRLAAVVRRLRDACPLACGRAGERVERRLATCGGGGDLDRARCYGRLVMPEIPHEYRGWWRIIETSQWVSDDIDICGTALISLTGNADRLRMFVLLAYVNCKPTKVGVSFTWEGAWEFDQVSGTGSMKLSKDGRLKGKIKIKDGDDSTFIAERTQEPDEPIPNPPSYRDKWKRRW
jgi:hypothetical protein